jgi:Raf kinase inhibitor-like YbhB/YbcL family protein
MANKKTEQESLDPSTVKIWLATVALVGLIVGGAVFLSAKKNTHIEPATQQIAAPVAIAPSPAPVKKEEKITKKTTPQNVPSPVAEKIEPPVPAFSDLKISGTAGKMVLTSPVIPKDGMLPFDHTCRRKNTSPPLAWSNAPSGTKSFVVAMDMVENDKAAPKSYWTLYGIDNNAKGLPAAVKEKITQGQNDLGSVGYVGPCGRNAKQLFIIRLFALDKNIDLPAGLPRKDVIGAMQGHILDTAELKFLQAM